ncbi:MAG: hypothetical protein HYX94_05965 [Chloroflexi bacterium]|nr:hypothetical protein [Chloroflexota bacterium]
MARGQPLKRIDINNAPDLLSLVDEVRSTNEPRILRKENEDVAIVRPMRRPSHRRLARGQPFTKDDSIWNLMGTGRSGVSDVSENKYKYLSEEYLDTHGE